MNAEQIKSNMIEGKIVKKLKRSCEVVFPEKITKKTCVLSHKDLVENPNTYLNRGDLPENSVVVGCGGEVDYLASLAPAKLSPDHNTMIKREF